MQKNTVVKEKTVKVIDYIEIGKVNFIRKPTVRNLKITIKPFREVEVSVPYFVSFETAGNFVREKQQWIKNSQARFARYRNGLTVFEENTVFQTKDHTLILCRHERPTIKTIIKNGRISVFFPEQADVRDPRIQKVIRKAVLEAWRMEAGKYLPEEIHRLASIHCFTYRKLTVRNNRTRWGSCTRNNQINLNIHLMRLPRHLCEYIILHELCHTVHKHHQKAFWLLLDQVTNGKARVLDKELNAFSPEVW